MGLELRVATVTVLLLRPDVLETGKSLRARYLRRQMQRDPCACVLRGCHSDMMYSPTRQAKLKIGEHVKRPVCVAPTSKRIARRPQSSAGTGPSSDVLQAR